MAFISATPIWMTSLLPVPPQNSTLQHIRLVFERLSEHGIVINPYKCLFGVAELDFLGHHLNSKGVIPLQNKVQAVRDFPLPQSQQDLR